MLRLETACIYKVWWKNPLQDFDWISLEMEIQERNLETSFEFWSSYLKASRQSRTKKGSMAGCSGLHRIIFKNRQILPNFINNNIYIWLLYDNYPGAL